MAAEKAEFVSGGLELSLSIWKEKRFRKNGVVWQMEGVKCTSNIVI